jgi:hypothetical protein
MITVVTTKLVQPEVGHVYKFVYNNVKRLAVVLADDGRKMRCWDFKRDDFRNFSHGKVTDFQDFTNSVQIIPEPYQTDINRAENAGAKVFHDVENDILYVANVK